MENMWAIILAAGKGKRMNAVERNKVTYEVGGKPMIARSVANVKNAGVHNIILVVGHAKQSVINLFDETILFAEQEQPLGTGHAVKVALPKLPKSADAVLVLYGDDSFLYSSDVYKRLITLHQEKKPAITFLTLLVDNPTGLGRVVRDKNGKLLGIVEEKDATDEQRKIREINPACYVFSHEFLNEYIELIPQSPVTGEYYLTSLIELAVENNKHIETMMVSDIRWRGVNTPEELKEAEKLLQYNMYE